MNSSKSMCGKDNKLMIMIGSSSTASKFEGKKKSILPNFNFKGTPLSGIQYDIQRFQKRFPNSKIIETSQDKSTLLSRDYIINTLKNQFHRTKIYQFYIFYSGHGHKNGDWAPQTIENPWADRIRLEQIVNLWQKQKTSQIVRLYIFMDSCYSGNWCFRLKQLDHKNICVFASCNKKEKSVDMLGGLFFTTILSSSDSFASNYQKLKKQQKPIFYSSSKSVYELTETYLKGLNQQISNSMSIYQRNYQPKIKSQSLGSYHQANNFDQNQNNPKQPRPHSNTSRTPPHTNYGYVFNSNNSQKLPHINNFVNQAQQNSPNTNDILNALYQQRLQQQKYQIEILKQQAQQIYLHQTLHNQTRRVIAQQLGGSQIGNNYQVGMTAMCPIAYQNTVQIQPVYYQQPMQVLPVAQPVYQVYPVYPANQVVHAVLPVQPIGPTIGGVAYYY